MLTIIRPVYSVAMVEDVPLLLKGATSEFLKEQGKIDAVLLIVATQGLGFIQ